MKIDLITFHLWLKYIQISLTFKIIDWKLTSAMKYRIEGMHWLKTAALIPGHCQH